MTTPQQPLGTPFGVRSTAREVLADIDLTGKTALITGGYSGIGLETTRSLVGAGATVIVPARRPDVAREILDDLPGVEVDELDLADLASVEAFAGRVLASGHRIDLLIADAAIMANPLTRVGPGWESQFATNHLGHFALVNRLWPALNPGARVVVVASGAHTSGGIRWDDIDFANDADYDRWAAYAQSKTANILFAAELDRRGQGRGIRAFSLDPGAILTPLQRYFTKDEMIGLGWIDENGVAKDFFKTPEQGAATQVWAATSPALDGKGGVYCVDCDIAPRERLADHATGIEDAARLWALSAERTGVDAFTSEIPSKEGG